jgi:hypothetical protein
VIARMWEARVEAGREDDVLGWLRATVVPGARAAGATRAELFRADERAVLITWWDGDGGWQEPEPPTTVVRAHAWPFTVVE